MKETHQAKQIMNTTEIKQHPLGTLREMVALANDGTPQNFSYQDMRELELDYKSNEGRINLDGSNLNYANLSNMNLVGIDLSECNLTGANLSGSDLTGGWLEKANLTGANLEGCNLTTQYLVEANFTNTNLKNVNFACSEISSSCIWTGTNLTGAYYGIYGEEEKIMMTRPPFVIDDHNVSSLDMSLDFKVIMLDKYILIGCQTHSYKKWLGFNESDIEMIGGFKALNMFEDYREQLIELADAHGCLKD